MYLKNFFLYSFFPIALIFANEKNLTTYTLEDFVIKSSPISLTTGDNSQSSKIILNKTLDELRSDTIADTLSFQSGISKTYYGPNANRPIIRGLDGYRVGILENGLAGFDLSATSNDHAVTINPLLIDRIEILKGSACLVHCGNSIAGLINVFDKSIPNLRQGALLENQFRTRFSSVNDGRNFGGIVFDQIGNIVFQINGSKITTSDYNTPKFEVHHHEHHHGIAYAQEQNDGSYIFDEIAEEEEEEEHEEEVFLETVENTHSEIETFGFGGSYNHDKGHVGLSFSNYSSEYGVPNHEDSVVSIEKDKFALESAYDIDSGYFDSVNFQLAYGDYSHTEEAGHEGHGEEITLYEYHSNEGKFEPHEHDDHDHHAKFLLEGIDSKLIFSRNTDTDSSALSISFIDKDMKIDGEESYLAAMNHLADQNDENQGTLAESENVKISNDSAKRFGIGFMQKKQLSEQLSLNGGFRYESLSRDYDATERADEHAHGEEENNHAHHDEGDAVDIDRDDNALNASIGFVLKSSDSITFSGNLHYSERIPETSELYSSGAHHATESFEMGNPDLKNEESVGVEFAVINNQGSFNQKLSLYYNNYNNFIFQSDTGFKTGNDKWRLANSEDVSHAAEDGITLVEGTDYVKAEFEELSIREYKGVEAKIYGLEYEFDYQLSSNTSIRGFADSITGKNKTDAIALPRIPPYRLGIGYYMNSDQYRFSLSAVHHGKQDKLANGEEETDAYTLLNARLGFSPNTNSNSELYLKINNLTDRLAYVHTSFLKESAPLPGRNVEIGYNITF